MTKGKLFFLRHTVYQREGMKRENDKTDLLLTRILSDEAHVEDILNFTEWYNSSEENKVEFQILKSYWAIKRENNLDVNSELAFEKFKTRIQSKKNRTNVLVSVAASILLLISGLYIIGVITNHSPDKEEYYTYLSETGTARVVLSDGTIVHLNKNSKLTYSDTYGKKNRVVELDGEAYFDVLKSETEFRVKLGQTQIKVFGTQFNVKAYSSNSEITTTLVSGSIGFTDNSREIRLRPNEQLIYNKINEEFEINKVEPSLSTSWKDGIYKFAGKPMEELCGDLEEIYRVKINLNSKYKKIEMSGSFEYKLKIEEVLDILKRSLPYKCQIKDSIIIIY